MPHDFDKDRLARIVADRAFIIGGETFTRAASAAPEQFNDYHSMTQDTDNAEALQIIDRLVLSLIVGDGDAERWTRVRSVQGDRAISLVDLQDVVKFLTEGISAHPTSEPSVSSDGPTTTSGTTPSTPDSSSLAAPAPPAST